VGREGEIQPLTIRPLPVNQFSIVHERELLPHDPFALVKCCESLAFLVRDVAHITPYNFENCVHCIRTFVEASLNGNDKRVAKKSAGAHRDSKSRKKPMSKRRDERARSPLNPTNPYDADESDSEELPSGYHQVSIQLLDLMHTLHTRTAQIFRWWAEENGETDFTSLWAQGWCPLLQGIARLCCDSRRQLIISAITYLQRALLVHDLQTLTAAEWESCFNKVLFPLLAKLLEPVSPLDPGGMEETRMRAATVLSKVFLHHLTPLLSLPTFTALWLTILDFMDKYMHADKSDLLCEAIPESLKNMLLVMDSARVFSSSDGYSQLWTITWDRIHTFLPTLKEELFKSHPAVEATQNRINAESSGNTSPVTVESPPSPPPVPEPVTSRSTSIILQPPARNVSTPIFTHLGQPGPTSRDMSSYTTKITEVLLSLRILGPPAAPVESPHPVLYTQPVTLYNPPTEQQPAVSSSSSTSGVMIPSHYFCNDAGQQQLFPVSVPTSGPNLFLLNPNLMEGSSIPQLPILSPPGGVNDSA
ncbi:hypothetical protein L9F63_001499, partial [Diploptera punctata]